MHNHHRTISNKRDIFVALYLACTMGMIAVLFENAEAADGEGRTTTFFAVSWVLLYGVTLLHGLVVNWRKRHVLAQVAVPVFYMVSTLWSVVPEKTLTYALMLLMNAVFSVVLVRNYEASMIKHELR